MHLICRCILPEHWNDIPLCGHSAGLIFVDTDLKFSILRLVSVIEKYVLAKATEVSKRDGIDSEKLECFIQECLKKFHIVRCSSSSQLVITLHNLETLICNESSISAVMIDSISAFYWIDRSNVGGSIQSQESNMKYTTDILSKLINTYSLTLFASKSALFKMKGQSACFEGENKIQTQSKPQKCLVNENLDLMHAEFMCNQWQRFVSHRLVLMNDLKIGNQSFVIGGDCVQGTRQFVVTEAGIQYS